MIKKVNTNLIFYNELFLAIITAIVLITWSFDANLIGIIIVIGLASVVIAMQRDTLPVVPMLLMCICCTSNNLLLKDKATMPTFIVLFAIFVLATIIHIIRFRPKFRCGSLTMPLVFISIALLLGGTLAQTKEQFARGLVFVLSLGVAMLVLYQILYNTFSRQPREKMQKYFAQMLMFFCLLVCAQMFIYFIKHNIDLSHHFNSLITGDSLDQRALIDLGWTNRAGISYLITILLPATFYLTQTTKKYAIIYYLLALVQYISIFFTIARNGILFCTIEVIVMLIYLIAKTSHRTPLILIVSTIVLAIAIGMLIFRERLGPIVDSLINRLFTSTSSGRNEIYKYGMESFINHPIFGIGLGCDPHDIMYYVYPNCIFWFHSTPIQILATTGFVGVIAYGFFYLRRFKMLFKHKNPFCYIMSLGIVIFELYSLLDSGTFIPFPTFLTVLVISIALEISNKSVSDEKILSKDNTIINITDQCGYQTN